VFAALWKRLRWFGKSEDGPAAVEYAVMLALIVTVCIATVLYLGKRTKAAYRQPSRAISKTVSS